MYKQIAAQSQLHYAREANLKYILNLNLDLL